jgi:hypothetical protein
VAGWGSSWLSSSSYFYSGEFDIPQSLIRGRILVVKIEINVYLHDRESDSELLTRLNQIADQITSQLETIMQDLSGLQAAVTAEDTVIGGAVTLLQGIPALIANAGVDPVALAALQTDITNQTASLAAAVVAGTPGAPAPAAALAAAKKAVAS